MPLDRTMLDYIAVYADIDPSTVQQAYGDDQTGLSDIFNVVVRNVKHVQQTALLTSAALPLSLALLFNHHTKWGVACGMAATLFGLGHKAASRGLDVAREVILSRLSARRPGEPV